MKVLVIGGAGYIGSFTTRALIRAGHQAAVLDDLSAGHRAAIPAEVDLLHGSIADADFLHTVFSRNQFDGVIHFAALTAVGESVRDPLRYYRTNVGHTLNLLEAMVQHGVQALVFSSSAAVYGVPQGALTEDHSKGPISPYGETKLTVERILAGLANAGKLSSVALRYFNACGADAAGDMGEDHDPETHLIPLVMGAALGSRPAVTLFGEDYETPDGTCIRDYVHVEDLASAHLASLTSLSKGALTGFEAFNLGTERGVSVREIISAAELVLKKKVPLIVGPRRPGDPPVLVADSTRIRSRLQWSPRYPRIEDTIETVARWMAKHPGGYRK